MIRITPEQRLLDVIKRTHGKLKLRKDLKIFTKVNIALMCLIVVILVIFLIDVFTFNYNLPEIDLAQPAEKGHTLDILDDHDKDRDEEIDIAPKDIVAISEEEMLKNFTLLGIIVGDNKQAVIEDRKANRTLFLYKGDNIGKFTVYDIKESSVILDYKGEKIELRM